MPPEKRLSVYRLFFKQVVSVNLIRILYITVELKGSYGEIVRPYLFLILGVIAISFAAIFIRLAEAPPLVIATYRLTIAAAVLVPFTFRKSVYTLRSIPKRVLLLVVLSSVLIALHFWLWILSLQYTSIASSVVLVTSHPAFVAALSYFLWKQKLTRSVMIGIIVVVVGVVIINLGSSSFSSQAMLGNTLALTAALAMGGYLVIGHHIRKRIDLMSYITAVYSIAAILTLFATVFSNYSLMNYSGQTYIMLILLAVVPQLIGHSSLNLAIRSLPAIVVSVAILGEPVGATILGGVFLDELPGITEFIGGIIIISGIIYVIKKNSQIASITVGNK